MSRRSRKPAPATLEHLREQTVDVLAWCNACGHNAVVPLRALIIKLGPRYPVPEVKRVVRCSACGSKDVETRPHWPAVGVISRYPGGGTLENS